MRRRPARPPRLSRSDSPPLGEHLPVLLDAVLDWLRPASSGRYVDATVGNGGHAAAILERSGPNGRLLGLDADPEAVDVARARLAPFGERATIVNASFRAMADVVEARGFGPVDGILMDLGISSRQLDAGGRGLSFRREEPLDMRLDPATGESALGPKRGRIHPATKSFQALRIAVNDELGALEETLPAAVGLLGPGGR